jgi:hypothetical protein
MVPWATIVAEIRMHALFGTTPPQWDHWSLMEVHDGTQTR